MMVENLKKSPTVHNHDYLLTALDSGSGAKFLNCEYHSKYHFPQELLDVFDPKSTILRLGVPFKIGTFDLLLPLIIVVFLFGTLESPKMLRQI